MNSYFLNCLCFPYFNCIFCLQNRAKITRDFLLQRFWFSNENIWYILSTFLHRKIIVYVNRLLFEIIIWQNICNVLCNSFVVCFTSVFLNSITEWCNQLTSLPLWKWAFSQVWAQKNKNVFIILSVFPWLDCYYRLWIFKKNATGDRLEIFWNLYILKITFMYFLLQGLYIFTKFKYLKYYELQALKNYYLNK